MAGKSLTITYVGDASKVLAAQKQIDAGHSSLEGTTKKTGGVFQSTFGSVMPLAAAAAGAAVIKFGMDSIAAFNEAEQVMAQTEAVLRSTGGAANVTAEDITGLAMELRELSGVDDEAIQASENLLLTFTRVRNEAGAGNDVFNQTEAAILDMATAMNQGAIPSMDQLKSNTILVGKAMNDPIKGLTALTRVGVAFTAEQKEQIAALVESGDVMGAQKIILQELQTEFGGAAKAAGDTFAGAQAKAAARVEDLQEKIGGILVPVIADLASTFADLLTDLEPVIILIGEGLAGAVQLAAENIETMSEPLRLLLDYLPQIGESTDEGGASWVDYGKAIIDIGNPITTILHPMGKLREVTDVITGNLGDQSDAWADVSQAERTNTVASERLLAQTRAYQQFAAGAYKATQDDVIEGHEDAAEAARDQRLAELALTDSFLGIVDSGNAVAESQRELNRLERQGKEDTKLYADTVLEALENQIALEGAVLSYGKELADSGEKARVVRQKVRELGDQFGIQDGIIEDLIREVQAYINRLNDIPSNVTTTATFTGQGFHQQLAEGGVVTRPTVALIGESGPEAVIPLSHGAGGFGVTVNIGTVVGPGGVAEVADIIRRELQKTGTRNVTVGLG